MFVFLWREVNLTCGFWMLTETPMLVLVFFLFLDVVEMLERVRNFYATGGWAGSTRVKMLLSRLWPWLWGW